MKRWPVCVLGLVASLAAQDGALADYRAGRFAAAHAALAAALAERGAAAPPELRANTALAALRLLREGDAEAAARPLLAAAEPEWRARGEQLLGFAAWLRTDRAVAAARLPDAEPMAWELAVRSAEAAWQHWRRAAAALPAEVAMVRNVERAWQRLTEVRAARDAATARTQQEPAPPPPEPAAAEPPAPAPAEVATAPLSAAELQRLRERLLQKQREKQRLRLVPPTDAVVGERTW
ncbi:MAG: hypothetical protein JNL08_14570 [Planctomycetes bacterium]|nr:hypothetical protein [Planctomycetota bacterium]